MPDTLWSWLERTAGAPDDVGIRLLDRREREKWLSWSRIHHEARSLASRLQEAGVEPGDRVALVFPTGREFLVAFFGALGAGAVPAPLYPPVRLGRLAEYQERTAAMLRAAGARLVLADARIRRVLGEAIEGARPDLGCLRLADLPPDAGRDPRPPAPTDLALVQFSSGTTRAPKPVALEHAAIAAQVRALNGFWPDTETVRHSGVSWLPLYHDMGLVGCVFTALERPGALTLIPPEAFLARPALWLRAISRYRATVSPAPDFAYAMAAERISDEELDGVDLSSWRVALDGAETVSPATLKAFARRFEPWGFRAEALTPVYGLSEASLAVTFSPPGRGARTVTVDRDRLAREGRAMPAADGRTLVSVGVPLPGFELAIRDPENAPLPAGREGRIWVRGPSLMRGYLGHREATADALVDGWLDTGDLGFVTDGELFVTGRAKDVVVVRGGNVDPLEIERAAWSVPGARTGCAVAVSRSRVAGGGEELLLFLEQEHRADDATAETLAERAVEAVRGALGLSPDHVVVLAPGTLPRTSSGKLRRHETLVRWEAGELGPPASVSPLRLAEAFVRSHRAHRRAAADGEG